MLILFSGNSLFSRLLLQVLEHSTRFRPINNDHRSLTLIFSLHWPFNPKERKSFKLITSFEIRERSRKKTPAVPQMSEWARKLVGRREKTTSAVAQVSLDSLSSSNNSSKSPLKRGRGKKKKNYFYYKSIWAGEREKMRRQKCNDTHKTRIC